MGLFQKCHLLNIFSKQSHQQTNMFRFRKRTVFKKKLFYEVSLLLASPDLFYFNVVHHRLNNETSSQCRIDLNTYSILKYYISIANFVSIATTYAIPLIIIIISYGRLMSHLSQNMVSFKQFDYYFLLFNDIIINGQHLMLAT